MRETKKAITKDRKSRIFDFFKSMSAKTEESKTRERIRTPLTGVMPISQK